MATKIRQRNRRRKRSTSAPSPPSSPSSCTATSAAFALASSLSFSASSLLDHSATLLLQNCLSFHDTNTFSSVSASLARIVQKYSPSSYHTLKRETKLALIIARPSLFNIDLLNLLELLLLSPSPLQPSQLAATISFSDALYLTSLHPPLYLSFIDTLCRVSCPRKHFQLLSDSPILRVLEAWNDRVVNVIVQGQENVANDIVQHLPPHLRNLLTLLLRPPPTGVSDSRTNFAEKSHLVRLNAARNRVLQGLAWTEEDIESEDVDSEAFPHVTEGLEQTLVEGLWMVIFGFANWREYATRESHSDPAAVEYLAWLQFPNDGYARVFVDV